VSCNQCFWNQPRGIGADAEPGAVTERHQSGVADAQIRAPWSRSQHTAMVAVLPTGPAAHGKGAGRPRRRGSITGGISKCRLNFIRISRTLAEQTARATS